MRTIPGLILVVVAPAALFTGVDTLIVASGGSKTRFPFGSPPRFCIEGCFATAALTGWPGVRLLKGSFLDRRVRGRGRTPARRHS